jgi:putative hydrolase of the HAD superfamily
VTVPGPRFTHVLFDFFGTLVNYSPSRTEQGFARSHDLTRTMGAALTYHEFLAAWSKTSERFDRLSDIDDREYSMTDIGTAFLGDVLGRVPESAEVDLLVRTYLSEWNKGVRYPPGIGDLLGALGAEYRLAVVSNTQEADLVPGHLEAMGVLRLFDTVVTSFEVGWRKPHPKIYTAALDELRIDPTAAVFVGDTCEADYHGPSQAGIRSFLIDPHNQAAIPAEARLSSIFELPARLAALA